MKPWSGIGINYGHQPTSTYNSTVVESDLTFLTSIGINKIRIAFPGYIASTSTANCQDMVLRALAHGFYVVWGVSLGGSNINATTWAAYKTAVVNTWATWAQSNGLSEFSVGNEAELQIDNTTLTATTVRTDVRALCTAIKTNGYTGKVSYQTSISGTYRTPWISEGIGSLDLIGWNSYDTLTNFKSRNATIVAAFGNQTYVSEFGCITNGFSDYATESEWYTDVINRVDSLQSNGVSSGYFFCYRDGGFGLTADTFALVLSTNAVRSARDAIKNVVAPMWSFR